MSEDTPKTFSHLYRVICHYTSGHEKVVVHNAGPLGLVTGQKLSKITTPDWRGPPVTIREITRQPGVNTTGEAKADVTGPT